MPQTDQFFRRPFGSILLQAVYFHIRTGLNALRSLCCSRVVATVLAREFPSLLPCYSVVLGEYAGFVITAGYEAAQRFVVAVTIVALFLVICFSRWVVCVGLLVGLILQISALTTISRDSVHSKNQRQEITLVSEPRSNSPGQVSFLAQIEKNPLLIARVRAIHLPWRNIVKARRGDTIQVQMTCAAISLPFNPFEFAARERRHGISLQCRLLHASPPIRESRRLTSELRRRLFTEITAHLGNDEIAGLILSMTFGFRDLVSERTDYAFRMTGLSHLLVVSGFHVSVLFTVSIGFLRFGARFCSRRQRDLRALIYILAALVALSFVLFVGIDGASLRAGIAVIFVTISRMYSRGGSMILAIINSLVVINLIWPGCIFEPGIQLTFAALLGIALSLQVKAHRWITRFFALAIIPTAFTSGVASLWFGTVPLWGFILNPLLAAPVSIISTIGGLVATGAYLSGLDYSGYGLHVLYYLTEIFRDLVIWCADRSLSPDHVDSPLVLGMGVTMILCALIVSIRSMVRWGFEYGLIRFDDEEHGDEYVNSVIDFSSPR